MWDCNLNQFEGCPPCSLAPHFPFHSLVHRPAVSALSLSRALRYFSTLGDLNGLTCRSLEQARRSRATTVKTCQTAWERNQPRRRAIIWHKVPAQIKVASSLLGLAEPSRQHPHPSPIPQQATHSKLHLVVLAFALYELMCSWTMLPFSTWNKQNRTVPFFSTCPTQWYRVRAQGQDFGEICGWYVAIHSGDVYDGMAIAMMQNNFVGRIKKPKHAFAWPVFSLSFGSSLGFSASVSSLASARLLLSSTACPQPMIQ